MKWMRAWAILAAVALLTLALPFVQAAADTGRVTRAYVDAGWGQIHFYKSEPVAKTDAPPLILFHENPASGIQYTNLMQRLGKTRLVIAPDTPGYGSSDGPKQPVSMEEYARALMQALRAAGIEPGTKFDVFGFHTGSLLAATFAALYPNDVRRMIVSGVPLRTEEDRAQRLAALKRAETALDLPQWFAQIWDRIVVKGPGDLDAERRVQLAIETLKPMQRRWMAYDAVYRVDIAALFARVRQPSLVMLIYDGLQEKTKGVAQYLSDGRIVDLPKVNRIPFDRAPDEVSAAMLKFLDEPLAAR